MESRIVDINGVKIEMDMRQAQVVESYHVGDKVKVLLKEYGGEYKTYPAVIVGFDNFKNLPTIVVAYLKVGWNEAMIQFAHINAESKGVEIVPMLKDEITIDKSDVIGYMDAAIAKKQDEVNDLQRKKDYFLRCFNMYFENPIKEAA